MKNYLCVSPFASRHTRKNHLFLLILATTIWSWSVHADSISPIKDSCKRTEDLVQAQRITSDRRLKKNIADLPLGLDFINRIRPVEYIRTVNNSTSKEWGVIAQELQKVLTEVNYKNAGIVIEDNSAEQYLSVRYNDLLAPMIKAIQEQDLSLQELKRANQEQKATIDALMKRLDKLEN